VISEKNNKVQPSASSMAEKKRWKETMKYKEKPTTVNNLLAHEPM
jgi:hypothetical protein